MIARLRGIIVFTMGCVAGAGCARLDATVSQPGELAGAWARLGSDTAWADTLALIADGTVRDQRSAATSSRLRWAVVRSRLAGTALCIGPARTPECKPYRLEGDTLILGRLPSVTFLRRVH